MNHHLGRARKAPRCDLSLEPATYSGQRVIIDYYCGLVPAAKGGYKWTRVFGATDEFSSFTKTFPIDTANHAIELIDKYRNYMYAEHGVTIESILADRDSHFDAEYRQHLEWHSIAALPMPTGPLASKRNGGISLPTVYRRP
jgi:hypothetical protein